MSEPIVQLTDEIKKEIGQHFIFGYHGSSPFEGIGRDILKLLGRGYWVGNVIMMKRNIIGSGPEEGRAREVAEDVKKLKDFAREEGQEEVLGVGGDQEGGLVSTFSANGVVTLFPGAMTLGSIVNEDGSPAYDVTEKVSEAQARELGLIGVNWVFAPVGDVNSERENPVIGVRSFGDDPDRVAKHVQAACKGIEKAGVAPCVKHFPGHGDTNVDSHLGLPRIWKKKEELEKVELVPWKELSGELVTVMTGHMALPLVTGETDTAASMSREVTTELLRESVGFNGVVVTDCLEMDAIAKTKEESGVGIGTNEGKVQEDWKGGPGVEEGAVRALEAGADVVMICHTFQRQKGAVEAVWRAVENGRISLDRLRESTERIRKWKSKLREEQWSEEKWIAAKKESAEISTAAYSRAVICLKEGEPLKKGEKTVVFTPKMESYNKAVDDADGVLRTKGGAIRNTAGAAYDAFVKSLDARHVVYSPSDIPSVVSEQTVFVLRNADRSPWQLHILSQLQPTAVLSTGTPYDPVPISVRHLAITEYTPSALAAVRPVLFADKPALGLSPVVIT